MFSRASAIEAARAFLLRGRNADGGWGYAPGKASRLEPTCWALLALGQPADSSILRYWPTAAGLLLERGHGSANYAFHGLALLALRTLGLEHARGNAALLAAMQRVKGDPLPESEINRQDNSLQGWSWVPGTFSWVEPTAWCLLALKAWRSGGHRVDGARIDVAERLLIDRCCTAGGWNYGNSNMLGQELKAYVPTTAVALLALQDRSTLPEVERSLEFLERQAGQESSSAALALAVMALKVFGRPAPTVRDTLLQQLPTTLELGKQMAVAMACVALLTDESDGPFAA